VRDNKDLISNRIDVVVLTAVRRWFHSQARLVFSSANTFDDVQAPVSSQYRVILDFDKKFLAFVVIPAIRKGVYDIIEHENGAHLRKHPQLPTPTYKYQHSDLRLLRGRLSTPMSMRGKDCMPPVIHTRPVPCHEFKLPASRGRCRHSQQMPA
jgi:hypothetical protein